MLLSTKGDYGVRAMIDLAKHSGSAGRFQSGEKVSDELPIPHHTGYAADPEALQV